MENATKKFYEKRAQILVNNLKNRHFEAWYCPDRATALEKALELIPETATVGWGGATSAVQIGLMDAVRQAVIPGLRRSRYNDPGSRGQIGSSEHC